MKRPGRPRRADQVPDEAIEAAYRDEATPLAESAARLGLDQSTISQRARHLGLPQRRWAPRTGGRRAGPQPWAEPASPVAGTAGRAMVADAREGAPRTGVGSAGPGRLGDPCASRSGP